MSRYEYRVIATPPSGFGPQDASAPDQTAFADALEVAMNTVAQDGWEYLRAESLPVRNSDDASGTVTEWRNVLVFRRQIAPAPAKRHAVLRLTDPVQSTASKAAAVAVPKPLPEIVAPQHPEDDASRSAGASRMLVDNGVEEWSEVSGISSSLKQLAESRKRARSNN